jgi:hypothetical protein
MTMSRMNPNTRLSDVQKPTTPAARVAAFSSEPEEND